jgi:hypothetical protein
LFSPRPKNRVAEEIRNHFPNVNKLISSVKKVFLKAPLRAQRYKEKMPNIPLPPEPVITRWGTWLNAAVFYAEHFQTIKELILEFERNHNSSIIKCQSILKTTTLQSELAFIKANYDVSKTITNLEVPSDHLKNKSSLLWSLCYSMGCHR